MDLTQSHIERIRGIFLDEKRLLIPFDEICQLPDVRAALLNTWLVENRLAFDPPDPRNGVPRGAAMAFALEVLPLEWIAKALGAQASVIPKLRRLQPIKLLLPWYEVIAIQLAASRRGRPPGDVVARELHVLVGDYFNPLTAQLPGFHKAMLWPPHLQTPEQPRWLLNARR